MTDVGAALADQSGRLPLSYLGATYLSHAVTTVGSALGLTLFLLNPDIWPGRWAILIFAVFLALRMVDPLYERWTTRIRISRQELSVASGLIFRRTRSIPWHAVRTIESTEPWALRLFRLVRVKVSQGGDSSAQLTLVGITRELRDVIIGLSPIDATAVIDNDDDLEELVSPNEHRSPADSPLYRATLSDLVFASLLYGRFAIVAGAVGLAFYEQLDALGLIGLILSLQGFGATGFAVLSAAVIVCIGIAATVLRFARLEVRRAPGGGIRISYGLIETRERLIQYDAITGVVLQRNPLEMLCGRARLALLTTDTAQQFGTNLLLPSLPRRTLLRILRAEFADCIPETNLATRSRSPLLSIFVFGVVTAIAGLCGWWAYTLGAVSGVAAVIALIVWALIVRVVRPLVTRLRFDEDRASIIVSTRFLSEIEIAIDAVAIHLATIIMIGSRPRYVRFHYYAGVSMQRSSLWFDFDEMLGLLKRLADRESRLERLDRARAQVAMRHSSLNDLLREDTV